MAGLPTALFPLTAKRAVTGELTLAGHSLVTLAEQFGTPLYLYDAATLRQSAHTLQTLLRQQYAGEAQVTYAAKAYFSPGIAHHLAQMGLGVDVVSLGELTVARQAGFSAGAVHLHGNNKSAEEIGAALAWDVEAIILDSLDELEFARSIAQTAGKKMRVWLRISPGIAVHTHAAVQTAHASTKFGIPVQDGQALHALQVAASAPEFDLVGLHTHLGSNLFEVEGYVQAVAALAQLAEDAHYLPRVLSPGGGWGVPYLPDQPENTPERWINAVAQAVTAEFMRRGWQLPRLVIEPGRWLAARAGVALYRVGACKTSADGTRFVCVDGGMADNIRPALYGSEYTAVLANRVDAEPRETISVAGKFCESGDLLIPAIEMGHVQRGDLLAMPSAGAYHLSMASNYNLAARPAVLWLEEGQIEVLQPREQVTESGWWGPL